MGKAKNQTLVAIGQQLRSLREKKGLSQEALADAAGLDRAYCGRLERGERNFTVMNLVRLAVALGVEPGDIFPPLKQLERLHRRNS